MDNQNLFTKIKEPKNENTVKNRKYFQRNTLDLETDTETGKGYV